MAHKESLMTMAFLETMCDGPYSQPFTIPKMTNQCRQARKYRTYGSYGCESCGKHYVTLVKRDGKRYCRDCVKKMDGGDGDA